MSEIFFRVFFQISSSGADSVPDEVPVAPVVPSFEWVTNLDDGTSFGDLEEEDPDGQAPSH